MDGWGSCDGCLGCLHGRVIYAITIMACLGAIVKTGISVLHEAISFCVNIDVVSGELLKGPSPFVP